MAASAEACAKEVRAVRGHAVLDASQQSADVSHASTSGLERIPFTFGNFDGWMTITEPSADSVERRW